MKTTHIILALAALLLLGGGVYLLTQGNVTEVENDPVETMPVEADGGIGDGAESLDELLDDTEPEETLTYESETVIGQSVNGTDITAHHFGNGTDEVLLITGVHGSYSKNTAALGDDMVTYFSENESAVPASMRVTVIPVVNPDGLALSDEIAGRFNANNVDLNRNFGCDWAETSMWRDQEVSGGERPFSEPEAAAVRDYVREVNAVGAIVWYAAEGKVYPSACEGTPSRESVELAATFAQAADYPAEPEFDAYQINGDMVNWLADEGIPAISVLLTDRVGTEESKNIAGVTAALQSLSAN
jgi:hypothetical protein